MSTYRKQNQKGGADISANTSFMQGSEARNIKTSGFLTGSYMKRPNYINPKVDYSKFEAERRRRNNSNASGDVVEERRGSTETTNAATQPLTMRLDIPLTEKPSQYKCPTTGARFVFGELGLRLLAAEHVRNNHSNLDEEYKKEQSTKGYTNLYRDSK